MKRVVIIGGGFAGLTVLTGLARCRRDFSLVLIDQKPTFDFLPSLPDVIGERISARHLIYDLAAAARKCKAQFICEPVTGIKLSQRLISTAAQAMDYDYAVIASGSQTAFYGNAAAQQYAFSLDNVADAQKALAAVSRGEHENFIVVGGGYTGIELATNIWRYCQRHGLERRILIVEKAPKNLAFLAPDLRDYVMAQLTLMKIELRLGTEVTALDEHSVTLSDGEHFEKAFVLWAAGVRTGDFVQAMDVKKTGQGRLEVDQYLRVNEHCFALGDTANVLYKGSPLRMAVQFTWTQGMSVASNIIRHSKGQGLKPYDPLADLGYVIPLANNRGCGVILGMKCKGRLPSFFHYFMCLFKMYGFYTRLGILGDLLMPRK